MPIPVNALISAVVQAMKEHNLAHPEDPISPKEMDQVVQLLHKHAPDVSVVDNAPPSNALAPPVAGPPSPIG